MSSGTAGTAADVGKWGTGSELVWEVSGSQQFMTHEDKQPSNGAWLKGSALSLKQVFSRAGGAVGTATELCGRV